MLDTELTVYAYQQGLVMVDDLTELRAVATSATHQVAIVGDVGGGVIGVYRWDAASTAADDGLLTIAPNDGGTGRWERGV